jgi:replicative DNA helicase
MANAPQDGSHNSAIPNPALLGDLAEALLSEEAVAAEARATGKAPGAVTGFPTLDEELGGFLASGIHALLAAPGAGKTALALQIAGNCGVPALYVTSEMRRTELLRRIIARCTDTYLGKLRGGEMAPEELRHHIARAARACPMLALYDATEHKATRADIEAKAVALRDRFESKRLLIVVDSVTDWATNAVSGEGDAGLTDQFLMSEGALNGLKGIATNLSCPVIAIAHRNRAGQKAKGADKLHTGKGTGRYEYVSESVWDLDRDPTQEAAGYRTDAELTILKNRHGSTGLSISLKFEGRVQRFQEA